MKRMVSVQMKCKKRLVERGPAGVAVVGFAVVDSVRFERIGKEVVLLLDVVWLGVALRNAIGFIVMSLVKLVVRPVSLEESVRFDGRVVPESEGDFSVELKSGFCLFTLSR